MRKGLSGLSSSFIFSEKDVEVVCFSARIVKSLFRAEEGGDNAF